MQKKTKVFLFCCLVFASHSNAHCRDFIFYKSEEINKLFVRWEGNESNIKDSILNNFEIFGINTQQKYSGKFRIAGQTCKLKGFGVENCFQIYSNAMISDVKLKTLVLFFNNGKLFGVSGIASVSGFREICDAFELKYGKPSHNLFDEWQNRIGSKFERNVKVWSFSDGLLKVESIGESIDEMEFTFSAVSNAPESDPPKINF